MKRLLTFLSLALLAVPLLADSPQKSRGPDGGGHEARMLNHLLSMDQAELTKLREAIERIEKMSPEEKKLLRQRIGRMQDMPPERIEALRERFEAIPKETRDAMRDKWLSLSPEERREWRQKLREMSHEERAKVFEDEGFLPTLGKGPGKPPSEGQKPPRAPKEKEQK